MPEVNRTWRIGSTQVLNPAIAEDGAAIDDWVSKCNGIRLSRGCHWGEAHFLIAEKDVAGLKGKANSIQCYTDDGVTTFLGWWLVSAEAITQAGSPAYVVRLADPRWLFRRSSAEGKRYNLRISETEYVIDTLRDGYNPWTWQELIADLWSKLPGAGTCPTIPNPPASLPENLSFDGLGAWKAICQCLTAIGHSVVYDTFAGTWQFVDLAADQSITYPDDLLYDHHATGSNHAIPANAKVLFKQAPSEPNSYEPFEMPPEVETASIGGAQGAYEVLDTLFNFEGRDLSGRAQEVARSIRWHLDPLANPMGKVYAGVWKQLPGSRISTVEWVSDGYHGFETRVSYQFAEIDWPKLPDVGELDNTIMAIFELDDFLLPGIGQTAGATVVWHNDPVLEESGATAITVTNTGKATGYAAYPGARGIALKVRTLDGRTEWRVIEVDQFCLLYTAELTDKTHNFNASNSPIAGSYADQKPIAINQASVQKLTPYPFGYYTDDDQVIRNPFNKHGIAGDTVLIAHVEDGYTYVIGEGEPIEAKDIIVDVLPAVARVHFVKYTENAGTGYDPEIQANGYGPFGNNSGEIPATLTTHDLFHKAWNAKANHQAIVARHFVTEKQVIVTSQHTATRVYGTVKTSVCNPTTFQVEPTNGLNGLLPVGDQEVMNLFNRRQVQQNEPVIIVWDNQGYYWYPEFPPQPLTIIEYQILEILNGTGPFTGLKVASAKVRGVTCGEWCLLCETVEVVDHSGCIFDLDPEDMVGYTGWAFLAQFHSVESGAVNLPSPCHFAAFNRCCAPNTGDYAPCLFGLGD